MKFGVLNESNTIAAVCHVVGVTVEDFFSVRRTQPIIKARHLSVLIFRTKFMLTYSAVARILQKDVSTVRGSEKSAKKMLREGQFKDFLERLEQLRPDEFPSGTDEPSSPMGVPNSLLARVQAAAVLLGTSAQDIVKKACEDYLTRMLNVER
jgi:hypothetical protein